MAIFPNIQSPCPHKGELSTIMDGDMCRLCNRRVVDLNPFSDADRAAFLEACEGAVCVSYKLPLRLAAAAAIATAMLAVPMTAAADNYGVDDEQIIIVGGINDPANVSYITDPRDAATPELPVAYDPQEVQTPAAPADNAQDASKPAVQSQEPASVARSRSDLGHAVENQ